VVEFATIKPCETSASIEVLPKDPLRLDLKAWAARLGAAGLKVVDAKALLVVQSPPKTTVFPSGRMLISTKDPVEAEARARQLFALAGVE
jgi:hypothetical protein